MSEVLDRLQQALNEVFAIERELGGGGMSRVFIARDTRLGRRIVVKVLPPDLAAELRVERFRREIQLSAQLRHPHIVPLLDAGEAADCLYYTMPYIEGESLRGRLDREGALPARLAVRFVAEVADALAYAHAAGVVHRDIKPDNILVDSDHAVVTDFGIARAISGDATSLTNTGVAVGTLAYMSPEQLSGGASIDARSDIYSLGCVLFELLNGTRPASALSLMRGEASAGVGSEADRTPPALREVVARALQPDPADRYQSALDFREALIALESNETQLVSSSAVVLPRRPSRRLVAAMAAVAVIAVSAGLLQFRGLRRGSCDAESIRVSGIVVDAKGKPVSGADAWVPPLPEPVLTVQDGSFEILVPNAKPMGELTVRVRRGDSRDITDVRPALAGCNAEAGKIVVGG